MQFENSENGGSSHLRTPNTHFNNVKDPKMVHDTNTRGSTRNSGPGFIGPFSYES